MRYHRFDLNLLPALKTLLAERNVTRAAAQLCVTQPAMSGILGRLRAYFGDPLIVQVGRQMELTPFAENLYQRVGKVLLMVDASLEPKVEFDARSSQRHFVIMATDYTLDVLLIDVLRRLRAEAPEITFEIRQPQPTAAAISALEAGDVDFWIAPNWMQRPGFSSCVLYEDTFCVVVDKDNAAFGDTISHEQYGAARHVLFGRHGAAFVREWVSEHRDGQLDISIACATMLPRLVIGTDRVATSLSRLAQRAVQMWPVRRVALGFNTERFGDTLLWHQFRDHDPAMTWFREQLVQSGRNLAPA